MCRDCKTSKISTQRIKITITNSYGHYRLWYKLSQNAKISVKMSVGESKSKTNSDSIGPRKVQKEAATGQGT